MNAQSITCADSSVKTAVRYDIAWRDYKLERNPVTPSEAAGIVSFWVRMWLDDSI